MRRTAWDRLRFVGHDIRNFVARVFEGAAEANVPFLASALTFDALLAAIPLVLLALSVFGYVLSAGAGRAQVEITEYLHRLLPGGGDSGTRFEPVLNLLRGIVQQRGTLGVLGVPLFVWFSTRLFGSLRSALSEIFDTPETRSWLQGKLVDVSLVVVTTLLFLANAAASEGLGLIAARSRIAFVTYFGTQLLAFAFILALYVVVFRFAPARRVRRDTAVVAAIICALGFEAAKPALTFVFAWWIRPDQLVSDATLGALLVFVAWMYYMTLVFLIGGQIAQVYELRRRQAAARVLLG